MSVEVETTDPGGQVDLGQGPIRTALPRRRGVGRSNWLGFFVPPLLVFLAFIGLWYFVSYGLLTPDRRFLVPPPHAVVQVAFLDSANRDELLAALRLSTEVAM